MELSSSRLRARLSFYRDRGITVFRAATGQKLAIDDLRVAREPALVERGRNEEGLIIAFTGLDDRLFLRVYEFFDTTKALGYSRILLRDKYRLWYQHGIDAKRPDFPSLIAYLQQEIAALQPRKVMCIGTSSAGHVAIAAGHLLRADYVHAFAPQTFLDTSFAAIRRSRYKRSHLKLRLSRRAQRELFDLAPLLRKPNGKTKYFLHCCADSRRDREQARRLSDAPGVILMAYPCAAHGIGIFLAKRDFLKQTLDFASQENLTEKARAHFGDGMCIDGENAPSPPAVV
jgi:hypothetical protein